MSISPQKYAANQANAQKSSGPTSDDGKSKSSQNATTHGLTGKTVVLPGEDMDDFQRFSLEVIACLTPEGVIEREFAQMVANAQWRLRRIKSVEDGMLTSGGTAAIDPSAELKTVEDAEQLARCFMDRTRSFNNLSQYEHRLYRTMTNALKNIKDLQAARGKLEADVKSESNRLFNIWQYSTTIFGRPYPEALPPNGDAATSRVADPSPQVVASGGFVFPTNEIQPLDEDENIAA
jgi:hypothetical protein